MGKGWGGGSRSPTETAFCAGETTQREAGGASEQPSPRSSCAPAGQRPVRRTQCQAPGPDTQRLRDTKLPPGGCANSCHRVRTGRWGAGPSPGQPGCPGTYFSRLFSSQSLNSAAVQTRAGGWGWVSAAAPSPQATLPLQELQPTAETRRAPATGRATDLGALAFNAQRLGGSPKKQHLASLWVSPDSGSLEKRAPQSRTPEGTRFLLLPPLWAFQVPAEKTTGRQTFQRRARLTHRHASTAGSRKTSVRSGGYRDTPAPLTYLLTATARPTH